MIDVSRYTVYRARKKATSVIFGDVLGQYMMIRDYAMTIMDTNPGSSVEIATEETGVEGELRFQRIYMCLGALKSGFLTGCRPIIGLDGCHLKSAFGGILLSAVGRDGNDNIYLIAVAAVESENKSSWEWFLELLFEDIGSVDDKGWVFISDRQKGLLLMFSERWPQAEHRFCVRHMWANFRDKFGSAADLKKFFWKAASTGSTGSTGNKSEWERYMKEIDRLNPRQPGKENAYDWFTKISPEQWSRVHFSTKAICAVIVNNLSESFNSYIK